MASKKTVLSDIKNGKIQKAYEQIKDGTMMHSKVASDGVVLCNIAKFDSLWYVERLGTTAILVRPSMIANELTAIELCNEE